METEKIEMIKKERKEYSDQAKTITTMESVLRTMMKMTGKSEEELRNEMRQELEELEREVSALKELLKTKPTPKAKGGKKKAETEGEEQKAEKEEKPKKAKAAPKKKAVVAAEASSVVSITEAATVTDEEVTVTEVKEEKPKAKKAAPKKKAAVAAVVATEATEGEVSEVKEEKPKAKKAAPKKKAELTEGEEKPKAKKAAPKKKVAAAATEAVKEVHEPELMQELEREMPTVEVTATEEDEEVEVEEIEYDGVKYLRSGKGIVYDIETSEEIGRWNEETKSIEVE